MKHQQGIWFASVHMHVMWLAYLRVGRRLGLGRMGFWCCAFVVCVEVCMFIRLRQGDVCWEIDLARTWRLCIYRGDSVVTRNIKTTHFTLNGVCTRCSVVGKEPFSYSKTWRLATCRDNYSVTVHYMTISIEQFVPKELWRLPICRVCISLSNISCHRILHMYQISNFIRQ